MITPLDIENKKFTKQMMKGYNVDEVDDFLDELTLEYGKLYKENAELKAQREELDTNVGKYKNIENTIQNTLIMAQKTADEVQEVAKKYGGGGHIQAAGCRVNSFEETDKIIADLVLLAKGEF